MPLTSWNSWPRLAVAVCALSVSSPVRPTARARPSSRAWPWLRMANANRAGTAHCCASPRPRVPPAIRPRRSACIRRQSHRTAAVSTPTCLGRNPVGDGSLRCRCNHLSGGPKPRREEYRSASRLRPRDARPEPPGGRRHALSGGARRRRTICRRTMAWVSPSISQASTRRPRTPIALVWRSRRTVCSYATISASLALSGKHEEGIEMLRALADEPGRRRATGRTWRSPTVWPAICRPPSGSAGSISTRNRCRTTSATSPRSRPSRTRASAPVLGVHARS